MLSRWATIGGLLALAALGGCQWAPKSRLVAAQSQSRTLAEQSKAQLAEIENLKVHTRQVEDQLIRAEAELGRRKGEPAGLAGTGSIPRRSGAAPLDAATASRLAYFLRRYPAARYDEPAGMLRFDADAMFEPNQVDLTPAAQQSLDELAVVLRAAPAGGFKLLVVCRNDPSGFHVRATRPNLSDPWHFSSERALAVAERLRKSGIADGRVGVAGFAEPPSAEANVATAGAPRQVEIYLLGTDETVVGWNSASDQTLR